LRLRYGSGLSSRRGDGSITGENYTLHRTIDPKLGFGPVPPRLAEATVTPRVLSASSTAQLHEFQPEYGADHLETILCDSRKILSVNISGHWFPWAPLLRQIHFQMYRNVHILVFSSGL